MGNTAVNAYDCTSPTILENIDSGRMGTGSVLEGARVKIVSESRTPNNSPVKIDTYGAKQIAKLPSSSYSSTSTSVGMLCGSSYSGTITPSPNKKFPFQHIK